MLRMRNEYLHGLLSIIIGILADNRDSVPSSYSFSGHGRDGCALWSTATERLSLRSPPLTPKPAPRMMANHMICRDASTRASSSGPVEPHRAGENPVSLSASPSQAMSSDGYFDDELDSAFLDEVDAIEAAHVPPANPPPSYAKPQSKRLSPPRTVIELSDDEGFGAFDVDEADLQLIDEICANELKQSAPPRPISGPSKATFNRTASKGAQTTLFGGILQSSASTSKNATSSSSKQHIEGTHSSSRNLFGGRSRKTKQWDQTAFAKTGWKKSKSKGKGKGKVSFGEDMSDVEEVEFEQFPAPFVSIG